MRSADTEGAVRTVGTVMVRHPRTHPAGTTVRELRAFFRDDHVHLALVVDSDGFLLTSVERADLSLGTQGSGGTPDSVPATGLGTLSGRTTGPDEPLDRVVDRLGRTGRRRLAVVDESGRLLGLLCRKRDGSGFCRDAGIRARAGR